MLAFIRDHNTARSVTEVFNRPYELLGYEVFTTLFPVILTDRGSEFTDPLSIEFNADGETINSYKGKKLGNRSAYQLFSLLHDEGLLEKLGVPLIPSNDINLTPLLLKK